MSRESPRTWRLPLVSALAFAVGLLLALGGAGRAARPGLGAAAEAPELGLVMIDPGHGGIDGGTNLPGVTEKQITLDVGLRVRNLLGARGITVTLTREADEDLGGEATRGRHRRDLTERITRTRAAGAAIMVSLHVNSSTSPTERGSLFFYEKGDQASLALARTLQAALLPLGARREPPIGRSNLFILNASKIPTVIIELGFLTHPEERGLLQQESYRQRLAQAIALGIENHLRPLHGPPAPLR